MLHVVLLEPEIPPNTGNIIRLCANAGFTLHLVHPLKFSLDEAQVKRAGLDYHELARVYEYKNFTEFIEKKPFKRLFACSTKATTNYSSPTYQSGDAFLFGAESRGLPAEVLAEFNNNQKIRIPMQKESRSLNLSNAVAIILYEAWRQLGFSD